MLNPGILLKGDLMPKLLNNPFTSCFFYKSTLFIFTHGTLW